MVPVFAPPKCLQWETKQSAKHFLCVSLMQGWVGGPSNDENRRRCIKMLSLYCSRILSWRIYCQRHAANDWPFKCILKRKQVISILYDYECQWKWQPLMQVSFLFRVTASIEIPFPGCPFPSQSLRFQASLVIYCECLGHGHWGNVGVYISHRASWSREVAVSNKPLRGAERDL